MISCSNYCYIEESCCRGRCYKSCCNETDRVGVTQAEEEKGSGRCGVLTMY